MLIKTLVFSLFLLINISAQITPYVKFQLNHREDSLVVFNPNTFRFVSYTGDTIKVVKINRVNYDFIELQTEKRLEMNVSYALLYKRRSSDPIKKTVYYDFFGYCSSCFDSIKTEPIERIK